MYLADMCLSEEEHTDSGLTDTAADGERKLFLQNGFLERQLRTLRAAGFSNWESSAALSTRIPMEDSSNAISRTG